MIYTVLIITVIVVFVMMSLFPGGMAAIMVLGGPGVSKWPKLRQVATGMTVSLGTGLACTVMLFVMLPIALIKITLIVIRRVIIESINYLKKLRRFV